VEYWKLAFGRAWIDMWSAMGFQPAVTILIAIVAFLASFKLQEGIVAEKTKAEDMLKAVLSVFVVVGLAVVIFLLCLFFVVPGQLYADQKAETAKWKKEETWIQWKPPVVANDVQTFGCIFGGHMDEDMISGNCRVLELQQLRSTKGVSGPFGNIKVRMIKNRVYFDVDIPTKKKPIQIRAGESDPLPEGWDWNSDSDALEIVDDQNQAVFQEVYRPAKNCAFLNGAIQLGGEVTILNASGSSETEPHGTFSVSEVGLRTMFEYPSSKYRGVRIAR
jgi:hypothetical protein